MRILIRLTFVLFLAAVGVWGYLAYSADGNLLYLFGTFASFTAAAITLVKAFRRPSQEKRCD